MFSLAGVVLGVGLQYLVGRDLETRKQLALQRSQAYIDYFRVIAHIAQDGGSKENLAAAADAKTRICVYGSQEAIDRLRQFEAVGASTSSLEGKKAIVGLIRAVRSDTRKDGHRIGSETFREILLGRANRSSRSDS